VRVRAGARAAAIARWVRALVPAAALLVGGAAAGAAPSLDDDGALVIDLDEGAGPLSVADALLRARRALGAERGLP
jgi:anti-sigma factor RsiW